MINSIEVQNFKIHNLLKKNFKKKISLIYGENGLGKTSLLEAISLFTVGNGVFNLNLLNTTQYNKIFFKINIKINEINYSLEYNNNNKQKKIFLSNNPISPSSLLEKIKIIGISPFTSLAFWHDSTLRRSIFNRIILQYDPSYLIFYKQYLKILKQRNTLIKNNAFNSKWASILDPILIKNGIKINEIRSKIIKNHFNITSPDMQNFIKDELLIEITPSIEEQLKILQNELDINFIGPHLSKFTLKTKNHIQLSTGQQRKILLAFLISNSAQNNNTTLLLDDIFSNLDQENINNLIEILNKQNFQTIITNTNAINNSFIENIKI